MALQGFSFDVANVIAGRHCRIPGGLNTYRRLPEFEHRTLILSMSQRCRRSSVGT